MTQQNPVEGKIRNKETVTRDELRELRASLTTLPRETLDSLKSDLGAYATAKDADLKADADAHAELLALQQGVDDERRNKMTPLEATGAELGEKAGAAAGAVAEAGKELAGETLKNATSLTYREFALMQDPKRTTGEKLLRGLGIVALLYGAYRAAKWVIGKKKSGFFGRALRFLGITALSVAAINYFGNDATAAPSHKPKRPPEIPAGKLLTQLPDTKSLIDGTIRPFVLDKKEHTIKFTHRSITLDGNEYKITTSGIPLDISKARREGGRFELEAGAFGKKGSIECTDEDLTAVLKALLTAGEYESVTKDGTPVHIARS